MKALLRPALAIFGVLTLLTGLIYPMLVTGLGQTLFPSQAGGSIILRDGKPIGSALIGQNFSDPGHFWGRPSATGPQPFNGVASSGSNQGPLNPALLDAVKGRVETLRAAQPGSTQAIPVELVTASASGLDPHISIAAALFQVPRVAAARNLPASKVHSLVLEATERPILGILGEPVVNVLRLNLSLDALR
ncbi:MAG: potassium-transporting ATPase subunit KdpC [Desulfobacterales bacterium]|nr:potassium-transporting ATPase subunit KdpC [Desulfobacterales bacterium]MDP3316289.1 potassium-transporting ATPase subunit KdpC [Devosia sp.]